jgi:hypothetical protein
VPRFWRIKSGEALKNQGLYASCPTMDILPLIQQRHGSWQGQLFATRPVVKELLEKSSIGEAETLNRCSSLRNRRRIVR